MLDNLQILCFNEGRNDFDIRYLGSLYVMFEFKSKDACKNFMSSDVMNHWILGKHG